MTLLVVALLALFLVSNLGSFLIGLLGRRELRLFRRAKYGSRGPETLDFTRSRIGL